jgi:glucose-1-phosphate adenylyltransferase
MTPLCTTATRFDSSRCGWEFSSRGRTVGGPAGVANAGRPREGGDALTASPASMRPTFLRVSRPSDRSGRRCPRCRSRDTPGGGVLRAGWGHERRPTYPTMPHINLDRNECRTGEPWLAPPLLSDGRKGKRNSKRSLPLYVFHRNSFDRTSPSGRFHHHGRRPGHAAVFPLTRERSKPAVPLAGKYRLVDIPISNCINSGLKRIYLLTQFNSASLHRHITQSYTVRSLLRRLRGILAAEQTLEHLLVPGHGGCGAEEHHPLPEPRLRLRPDPQRRPAVPDGLPQGPAQQHEATQGRRHHRDHPGRSGAPPVLASASCRSTGPADRAVRREAQGPATARHAQGRCPKCTLGARHRGWRTRTLPRLDGHLRVQPGRAAPPARQRPHRLRQAHHPGRHRQPRCSYVFQGYWEDIGTIRSFFEANLDLTRELPQLQLLRHGASDLHPPALPAGLEDQRRQPSITPWSPTAASSPARISHSVIGVRSLIWDGADAASGVRDGQRLLRVRGVHSQNREAGWPPVGIGRERASSNAIIDKNARIGANCVLSRRRASRRTSTIRFTLHPGRHSGRAQERRDPRRHGGLTPTASARRYAHSPPPFLSEFDE